ncbi:MAG: hypothetical protein JXQ93_01535 [Flavobacteriaceae bacterium]
MSCKSINNQISDSREEIKNDTIRFLSDDIEAFGQLEDLQKVIYNGDSRTKKWTNSGENIKALKSLLVKSGIQNSQADKLIEKNVLNLELPTRYENPISYFLLKRIQEDVELSIEKRNLNKIKVGIGTLPYWSLNAKTYNEKDFSLIVANSGLFNFIYEMTKILLETGNIFVENDKVVIQFSDEVLKEKLNDSPDILVRFSKALEDYANRRVIRGQSPPTELQQTILSGMVNSMEFFTIAHEYGHAIYRHKVIGTTGLGLRSKKNVINESFKVAKNNWEQEVIADLFALTILEKTLQDKASKKDLHFYSLLRTSPELFFNLSTIAEESKPIFKDRKRPKSIDINLKDKFLNSSYKLISGLLNNDKTLRKYLSFNNSLGPNSDNNTFNLNLSHPPDYIRAEYSGVLMKHSINQKYEEPYFEELGNQLSKNLNTIWEIIKPILIKIIEGEIKD